MKNNISTLFISSISFAQTGINYQGAATDSDGANLPIKTYRLKHLCCKVGLMALPPTETHTTDQFGLFNVVIGQGVSISRLETISWGQAIIF